MENFINEAYVGKTRNLMEAEAILDQIIIEAKKDKYFNINKSPLNVKLKQTLEREFNIARLSLFWSNVHITNAFTIVNSHAYGAVMGKGDAVKVGRKYYEKSQFSRVAIIINSQFIYAYQNITGAKLLALILHEIGHNFEYSVYNLLCLAFKMLETNGSYVFTELFSADALKDIPYGIATLGDRIVNAIKPLKALSIHIGGLFSYIGDYLALMLAPIAFPIQSIAYLILSPLASFINFIPRKREEFADSFAVLYGYGPELVAVFDEIIDGYSTDVRRIATSNPFLSVLYDMGRCGNMMMFATSDHASNEQRTKKMLDGLKTTIDRLDYPADVKEVLYADYKDMSERYQKMITKQPQEKMAITKAMLGLSHRMLKGYDDLQYNITSQYTA